MEYSDHLAGMLDRDQRTAKLRYFCDKVVSKSCKFTDGPVGEVSSNNSNTIHYCYSPARRKNSNTMYLRRNSGYFSTRFQRFTNVLILGVYLSLVTLPSVSSAPVNLRMSDRMKQTPKWIHPCETPVVHSESTDQSSSTISDFELLDRVVIQADIARRQVNSFKDVFANKIHGMPFDQVHKLIYKGQPNFLNMPLPKAYSEDIPADILSTLEINETLLDLYGFLQKVAVGLEQAIWDQEDNDGDFATQFKETEKFLRVVLCELLTALEGRGVAKRPDVTRDVLKDEDRRMDHTGAQSRDFKILREYITVLDYTVKALSHFMTHLS